MDIGCFVSSLLLILHFQYPQMIVNMTRAYLIITLYSSVTSVLTIAIASLSLRSLSDLPSVPPHSSLWRLVLEVRAPAHGWLFPFQQTLHHTCKLRLDYRKAKVKLLTNEHGGGTWSQPSPVAQLLTTVWNANGMQPVAPSYGGCLSNQGSLQGQ